MLIGRERELATLSDLLESAIERRPKLVLCGGEPGIGKTRLAAEVSTLAEARGVPTVWARAPEGTAPPPFRLWRQVLGSDGGLAGAPASTEPGRDGFDAGVARLLLFDAVVRRLVETARPSGMLVVLDDVHWADQPSLLLLQHVAHESRQARLMIMATYRTVGAERSYGWQATLPNLTRATITEHIQLSGLSTDETTRCVSAVTGAEVPTGLVERLHRLSGGNPFFARELGRSIGASGDSALVVPGSVLEVVRQRVGRLSPPTRRFLAVAAVLGEQFPLTVAASLVDRPVVACLELLEEAAQAGFLEAAGVAGDWRFGHALVRDAVEAQVPPAEAVGLHRAAAESIERTYGHQLDARAAQLARHWAVVAVTGDRANAVRWARRAAEEAMSALAYEEGARLYRLALDAGGPEHDTEDRSRLLLALATAYWHSGELERCQDACREVVDLGRRRQRPDVVGEAALVFEPVGSLRFDRDIRDWCTEALAGLEATDVVARAPLLARLAEASVYMGDDAAAEETSRIALALADKTSDDAVVVAALRARQLALSGPEHVAERGRLADRMVEAGERLHRPSVEMWGRLWKIDTHWELGDLAAIASALSRLEWCVERVGGPVARWHLLIPRAALAQALGRFDQAVALGREAFESVQAARHPTAFGAFASLLCPIGHHIGHDRTGFLPPPNAPLPEPVDPGEVRSEIFSHIAPAMVLAGSGRLDEAAQAYRGAGPVVSWRPPAYFRILSWAVGSLVAVTLGQREDVEVLYERLSAERGRHAVAGAGNASYFGPVELHLGRMAAYLGRLDNAEVDLTSAAACCRGIGAAAFAVEADCELAAVLAQRGAEGDLPRARALSKGARSAAGRLGMTPWQQRAATVSAVVDRLQAAGPTGANGPLSPREMEVAELVAQGLTNREIAAAAFISERTAQTHVQHILTKLGLSNRSQIASWVANRRTA